LIFGLWFGVLKYLGSALPRYAGVVCIMEKQERVPLWNKYMLTISEASEVFNIGENKLRFIIENNTDADFVIMNGNRSMIKRKLFEQFLDQTRAI